MLLELVLELELDVEDPEEVGLTLDVLVVEILLEVKVVLEDDEETSDSDTQRTWPIDKSQLVSRLGL